MTNTPSKPESSLPKLLLTLFLLIAIGLGGWGAYWLIQHDALKTLVALNRWLAENFIDRLGYLGVFALMFIESSFVPFPSEIVIPPAGDLASRDPSWNLLIVILMGILGSIGGALLNYGLARWLGRPMLLQLIVRYGRYFHLSEKGYLKAEAFFLRHGVISTFIGRLIPGIRQLVSLPAGLAGMPLLPFVFFTSLGAGIWVVVLALLGYWFGSQPELLNAMLKEYSRWLVIGAVVVAGGYLLFLRLRASRQQPD